MLVLIQRCQNTVHHSLLRTGLCNKSLVFPEGCGLFQQCHKSKLVQEGFEEHNKEFEVLTWPPNSPDLNPVEHLWDVLDKQVRSMEASLSTYRTDMPDRCIFCCIQNSSFSTMKRCTLSSAQCYSRQKIVPTGNCSQQELWIIFSNQIMFIIISRKRHSCWLSQIYFLFATLNTTMVPSSSILLERRQTSIYIYIYITYHPNLGTHTKTT